MVEKESGVLAQVGEPLVGKRATKESSVAAEQNIPSEGSNDLSSDGGLGDAGGEAQRERKVRSNNVGPSR
jgi:hypothetical protein